MAWTTTKNEQYAAGNLYIQIWELAGDSGTVELNTGLSVLRGCAFAAKSLTSSIPNVRLNALSAGTASNGYVSVTGCTSGDTMYLTVYGR
jgi:hypothetical protein